MTECTESAAELQLRFDFGLGKALVGKFDGGEISSDGGLPLLRLIDDRLEVTELISLCLGEKRHFSYIKHDLKRLIQQRLYMIAAGYEDVNDAQALRHDAMFRACVGAKLGGTLASQPTLCRLENGVTAQENGFLKQSLVHLYIQKHKRPPKRITLDIDTTCDPVHGYQQLSFFNGFYHTECYIPLFMFDQDGYPLLAVLRPGNYGPAEDVAREIGLVLKALREAWPNTEIDLRADAAFCNRDTYKVCEDNGVTYFIGLKSNHALRCLSKDLIERARHEYESLYGLANAPKGGLWRKREERLRFSSKLEGRMQERFEQEKRVRIIAEVWYRAGSWDSDRRIVVRCDYTEEGPELRFVVTNSRNTRPKWIYEDKYCQRGQCENWIKELKSLSVDRLSCQEFEANQFRLTMHCFAYVLLGELRSHLSKNARNVSIRTIIQRFVKIGVRVQERARRILLSWTSSYPWQREFAALNAVLLS